MVVLVLFFFPLKMQFSFMENVSILFRVSLFSIIVFPVSYILFPQKKMQFHLVFTQKKMAFETRGVLDLSKETGTDFCTGKAEAMGLREGTFLIKKMSRRK